MELTSIDYARLVQHIAISKYMIRLGKVQIHKILYYVYGVYLAETGEHLFDERPQAWAFGPVFPRVNRAINPDEYVFSYPQDKINEVKRTRFLPRIVAIVRNMRLRSATELTRWSHQFGSPWNDTVYEYENDRVVKQHPWSTVIDDEKTKEYFKHPENRIYG